MSSIAIQSPDLRAQISPLGAELVSLQDAQGRDYLWNGDPEFWGGRAPLLFPIVGKVPDDRIMVNGRTYPMRQHGLARHKAFDLVASSPSACVFALASSEETRRSYPFDFRLEARYEIHAATLRMEVVVTNEGSDDMPFSFGFHPAFRWPLPEGGAKEAHRLIFDEPETRPIRRLDAGLLRPSPAPNPVEGRLLALREELFAEDVMIFESPTSRALTYAGQQGPAIRVAYPDMPHLGLWSRPGAGFICLEPWQGFAAPHDFTGELATKPGVVRVAPAASRRFEMTVSLIHQP
ncbi:MAG: aldose 1-epimerase family protein [Beijerinckiaceae bacterium]|nr:aldose 1-epimerase family protein [Beijerinckiaceae bacterium]